jgi:hypothetical protein
MDYLFGELNGKPAMLVSYGGRGGDKAAQQLRQVCEGLRMNPLESPICLTLPDWDFSMRGPKGEDLYLVQESTFGPSNPWSVKKEEFRIGSMNYSYIWIGGRKSLP